MRSPSPASLALTLVIAGLAGGCGNGKAPVRTYTIAKAPDPLDEVRALLKRYADGQPVGSEVTSYGDLVARVRVEDGARADVLEAGLEAIAANPRTAVSQARQLLERIGPAVPGP